jgi:hypothetical protein
MKKLKKKKQKINKSEKKKILNLIYQMMKMTIMIKIKQMAKKKYPIKMLIEKKK